MLIKEFLDPSIHLPTDTKGIKSAALLNSDIFFGVELELEGCPHHLPNHGGIDVVGPYVLPSTVRAHKDGSLRNGGIELVTKPIRGQELVETITYVCGLAREAKWVTSNRAGLHIHVNTQNLTIKQWINLIQTYILVEPCFFYAIGQERRNSIYCKSWYQHGDVGNLQFAIKRMQTEMPTSIPSRYFGLNVNSTGKYGTLEFRHHSSTTNEHKIISWINTISRWFDYGKDKTWTVSEVKALTPEEVVTRVFGDLSFMEADFPSHFYHSCVPIWFELFGGIPPKTRSWDRVKPTPHKGYNAFLTKRKTQVTEVPPITPAPAFLADQPNVPIAHTPSYFSSEFGEPLRRVYYQIPPRNPALDRPPGMPVVVHTQIGVWQPLPGRPDLYFRSLSWAEMTQHQGAMDCVYIYAQHLPH